MKRLVFGLLFLLCFTTISVEASSPPRNYIRVEITNYEGIVDVENLNVDLLMLSEELEEPVLRDEFKDVDYGYSFRKDDYYSIRAYEFNQWFDFYFERNENTIEIDCDMFYETTYYLVLYDDEGTVYYNQLHNSNDVGYSDGFKIFSWFEYDVKTNTMTIESDRKLTLLELVGIIVGVIVIGGIFTAVLFTVSQNVILKKYIGEDVQYYKKYTLMFSLAYLFGTSFFGSVVVFSRVGPLIIFTLFYAVIVYYFKRVTDERHGDHLSIKHIMIVELPPYVLLVLYWVFGYTLIKSLMG